MVYKHHYSLWSWPEQDSFFGFSLLQEASLNIQTLNYRDSIIRKPITIAILILWTGKGPRLHPAPTLPRLTLLSCTGFSLALLLLPAQTALRPPRAFPDTGTSSHLKMIQRK